MGLVVIYSCSTTKQTSSTKRINEKSNDVRYGYSESNPIKVGGASKGVGPSNERDYLHSLSGPNGEHLEFNRIGSCCAFETENSPFGSGLLDKYWVTYEGKEDTIVLYINMYDEDVLYAPEGFKFRM